MATTQRLYRIRKIGTKFDYIRRYKVIDPAGKRVDNVRGGLVQSEAQEYADDLNERHGLTPPSTDNQE